jgi:hypothetical protein
MHMQLRLPLDLHATIPFSRTLVVLTVSIASRIHNQLIPQLSHHNAPSAPRSMKTLKIKNRSASPLYFVFCTKSTCTCSICSEWIDCETLPIVGWGSATYGKLQVEGFTERTDRFCERWDCVGACFFGSVPTVRREMLFDYDEGSNYTIGDGKAELSFTHTGQSNVQSSGLKYLRMQNHGADTLFFAFCTTSTCQCHICQEWLVFETIPIVDKPNWTVGRVIVEPFRSRTERFCSQWDCIGACFLASWPSEIKREMLFDYDETKDYTIGGGKAELCFAHKMPQPASNQLLHRNSIDSSNRSSRANSAPSGRRMSGAFQAGAGIIKAASAVNHAYQGAQFINDVFDGTTGPEDNGVADAIGTALDSAECTIS